MSKNQKNFFVEKNEWSKIKDSLLQGYLPQYFQKLMTSRKPIYYVDCFAGKGKFDDNQPGSPLIAMEIIDKCLRQSRVYQSMAIQPCFIELNHANDLELNLNNVSHKFVKPEVVRGSFENTIRGQLQDKRGYNVFLYIDPYGIRALDSQLFSEFQTYGFNSFEMLINFNSFGFFRDACRVMRVEFAKDEAFQGLEDLVEYEPTVVSATQQSKDLLTRIAGGDYWMAIVKDYKDGFINGYQAEKRFSNEYKHRLKQRYKYVLDIPIRLKQEHRPKYRMIHVCDHEDGCFLMADNMQRRKDELFTNVQQGGQMSIFDVVPDYTATAEGEILTESDIEKMVKNLTQNMESDVRITVFLAQFCNEYGIVCPFTMIHTILERMEENGEIDIVRNPAMTKAGKKRRFWDEKDGKTVTIRRHQQ